MKKLLICLLIFVGAIFISCNFVINATTTKTVPEQPTIQTEPLSLIVEASAPSTDILLEEEPAPTHEQEPLATREEIELLALCAMAEAEGECEQGQRLVIDSVLNRVDDPHFPDTISEVIWQKNQYAGMYGDRITRCYVMMRLLPHGREQTGPIRIGVLTRMCLMCSPLVVRSSVFSVIRRLAGSISMQIIFAPVRSTLTISTYHAVMVDSARATVPTVCIQLTVL